MRRECKQGNALIELLGYRLASLTLTPEWMNSKDAIAYLEVQYTPAIDRGAIAFFLLRRETRDRKFKR